MPKAHGSVKVWADPQLRMVFHVESWTTPGLHHTVDLLAHEGRGACTCKNWGTRCWPFIRDDKPEIRYGEPGSSLCRHVEAARLAFLRSLLKQMAKVEREGSTPS